MAHEERRGPRARRRGHPRPLRRRRPALRRPRRETRRAPLHPGDARRRRGVLLQLSRHAQVHRRPRDALRQGGRHRFPPATRRRDRRRVRAPRSRSESRGRFGHDGGGHLPAQGRRERAGFRRGRRHSQVRVGRRLEGGHVPRRRAVLARRPVQGSQARVRQRGGAHSKTVQPAGGQRLVRGSRRGARRVHPRWKGEHAGRRLARVPGVVRGEQRSRREQAGREERGIREQEPTPGRRGRGRTAGG
mmetsp:Transcript_5910/g.24402  ORF Transcript_5910/g.24402 Transcript_5910/m.24402 type:complete len:246 (-) Transcript_5910:433-1170(-)